MQDFFKYLTPSEQDKNWGIYLTVGGKAVIPSNSIYPSSEHPSGYFFTQKKGRVLEEYQLNYIVEGEGVFQNEKGQENIQAGSFLIIRPHELHSYYPNANTGWVENYVGFKGALVDHFFRQEKFLSSQAVFFCGIRSSFLDVFYSIFKLIQEEKPGYQQIATGLLLQLIGKLIAYQKQEDFTGKPIETIIQKVRLQMQEQVGQPIDLKALAKQHHIGYANFRKMFKRYTGISPRQYHLELKIMRAKELLLTSDKSVREIGQELNFESIHYFSRYFKKRLGYPPTALRKHYLSKKFIHQ